MGTFHDDMAAGYGFEGPSVRLGRPFADPAAPDTAVEVGIPLRFLNRHGLIAGATGTGKTRTLQLIAEQISAAGCPVFAADMKGDLAGIGAPGTSDDRLAARATELAHAWAAVGAPVELLALSGNDGVPLRTTVTEFGSALLSKVLELNETQESSLGLIFRFCDEKALPLLDLEDLRAALAYLTGPGQGRPEDARRHLRRHRRRAAAQGLAAGVRGRRRLLRRARLRGHRPAADGARRPRASSRCSSLADVARQPALFSTFLMWVLAELFERLPRSGDPEKPNLVFFFDEAHLLFDGASKAFLDSVAQTVRLIRSKGVGVFFITQLPTDVPDDVLSQLGHRVQHAVRAFTPKRRAGAEVRGRDLPDHRALRPGPDAPVARGGGGRGDRARPARRPDPGGGDAPLPARLAHDAPERRGAGRGHRRVPPAAALRGPARPRERRRAAGGPGGGRRGAGRGGARPARARPRRRLPRRGAPRRPTTASPTRSATSSTRRSGGR